MVEWLVRIGTVLALALLALTFVNASWLAPTPRGNLKLVAHRGVHQHFDREAAAGSGCPAAHMTETAHPFLESTIPALTQAFARGADFVVVDLAMTADGRLVLYPDEPLECRSDGSGRVSAHTLAELKALDIGYRYTPDGGETFPRRGTGVGQVVTVEEAARALPAGQFMFRFVSDDPRQADRLLEALRSVPYPAVEAHAYFGAAAPVGRIRELVPQAWAFTVDEVRQCTADYRATGWLNRMPESCRGGTIAIPLNRQWVTWGWPNRFIARMEAAGTRMVVIAPDDGGEFEGLERIDQLAEVPASYTGHILVEDIWNMGPALVE